MSKDYTHKLRTFESPPPQGAWEKIVTALDETSPSLSDRLSSYEQAPPAQTWEKIAARLPLNEGAKVVPFFQRYRRQVRYATATAALVVVGLLTSLLLSKRTESSPPVANTPTVTRSQPVARDPEPGPSRDERPSMERPASAGTENRVASLPANDLFTGRSDKLKRLNNTNTAARFRQAVRSATLFRSLFAIPEQGRSIALADGSDRYMVYSDGEGRISRLPKRLYDAVHCRQEDLACQEKIRNLQQKIASSAYTADFNGVLQIIGNLEEKK